MNTQKTRLASSSDYSARVEARGPAIGAVRQRDLDRKKRIEAGPPPVPASAQGIELSPNYKPPQNELNYVTALLEDAEKGLIERDTALIIQVVQLRKAENAEVIGSAKDLDYARKRAEDFDVDPVF